MIVIDNTPLNKRDEAYLYTIAKRVLSWAEVEPDEAELWDLIMQELADIRP